MKRSFQLFLHALECDSELESNTFRSIAGKIDIRHIGICAADFIQAHTDFMHQGTAHTEIKFVQEQERTPDLFIVGVFQMRFGKGMQPFKEVSVTGGRLDAAQQAVLQEDACHLVFEIGNHRL